MAVAKDGTDRELYAKQLLTEAVQFRFPIFGFLAVGCCGWAGKVICLTPTLKPDFNAIGWDRFRLPARGHSWTVTITSGGVRSWCWRCATCALAARKFVQSVYVSGSFM